MTKQTRIKQHEGRLILFTLRRKWGIPADFYKISVAPTDNDFEAGKKGISRTKYTIPAFVTCQVSLIRKFEYDIGYLAANKNFTYGGFFEQGDRLAVLDATYLPDNLTIEQKDYFIFDNQRYDVQRIEALDHRIGWLLHLRVTKENKRYAIVDRYVYSHLDLEQDINETL